MKDRESPSRSRGGRRNRWTVADVASEAGVCKETVRRRIADRTIPAARGAGNRWEITDAAARRYIIDTCGPEALNGAVIDGPWVEKPHDPPDPEQQHASARREIAALRQQIADLRAQRDAAVLRGDVLQASIDAAFHAMRP
ncbi:hypothetical protein [Euzebya sp.]|uniref:hypothetical protein n=1 Tax=Euzebya sp. TaxID=1971409 RepID=UPI003512AAF6